MKILIVSQYFWPENFRINYIATELSKRGHKIDVLTGKPNYPHGDFFSGYSFFSKSKETWNSLTIFRVPLIKRGRGSTFNLILNYLSFLFFATLQSPFIFRNKKYDLVFAYGLSPILSSIPAICIGKIKCIPVVIWVQDLWPESLEATNHIKNKLIINLVALIVKFIYRNSRLLLIQSKKFYKNISKYAGNTEIIYFPNSIDPIFEKIMIDPPKSIKVRTKSFFSIVFAGNLGLAQSVEVITKAAFILRDHQDVKFLIYGDGSMLDWMLKEVTRLKLNNIKMMGRLPEHQMPSVMQNASALLVTLAPKKIFSLTIPNKIQAYLASGRPIIGCLNGIGAKIIKESNSGITAKAGDAKALSNAILHLKKLPSNKRNLMGKNGKLYYKKNFSNEMLIQNLIDIFKGI